MDVRSLFGAGLAAAGAVLLWNEYRKQSADPVASPVPSREPEVPEAFVPTVLPPTKPLRVPPTHPVTPPVVARPKPGRKRPGKPPPPQAVEAIRRSLHDLFATDVPASGLSAVNEQERVRQAINALRGTDIDAATTYAMFAGVHRLPGQPGVYQVTLPVGKGASKAKASTPKSTYRAEAMATIAGGTVTFTMPNNLFSQLQAAAEKRASEAAAFEAQAAAADAQAAAFQAHLAATKPQRDAMEAALKSAKTLEERLVIIDSALSQGLILPQQAEMARKMAAVMPFG